MHSILPYIVEIKLIYGLNHSFRNGISADWINKFLVKKMRSKMAISLCYHIHLVLFCILLVCLQHLILLFHSHLLRHKCPNILILMGYYEQLVIDTLSMAINSHLFEFISRQVL